MFGSFVYLSLWYSVFWLVTCKNTDINLNGLLTQAAVFRSDLDLWSECVGPVRERRWRGSGGEKEE